MCGRTIKILIPSRSSFPLYRTDPDSVRVPIPHASLPYGPQVSSSTASRYRSRQVHPSLVIYVCCLLGTP